MTSTLRVQKSQSIADVEMFLADLAAHKHPDLLLNLQLVDWHFGGIASLIQLFSTWSKRSSRPRLITHIQDKSRATTQLRNLAETDHGLLALTLAADVVTANRQLSVAREANEFIEDRLQRMSATKLPTGPQRLLMCADHLNFYCPHFYYTAGQDPVPKLKPEGEFSDLMQALVSDMVRVHYHARQFRPEFASSLGSILYELFSNTHRWARDEWDRMPITRSIRGVRLEAIRGKRENLLLHVRNNPRLSEYIAALPNLSFSEQILLEVSVFDSGSGLAAQWLKTELTGDLSLERERKGVVDCLQKHATSQPKSHHGLGLHVVMQQLDTVKGFLRIRTGRLNLYRDFITHPFTPVANNSSITHLYDLFDWATGTPRPSLCAKAEGTLYSMLIPVPLEAA